MYDAAKADDVLRLLTLGVTLPKACAHVEVMRPTFLLWVHNNPDGLADRYARARQMLLDYWADELIEIADNGPLERGATERDKLKIESRKWLLSKLKPEQYGDKSTQSIDMTLKGEDPASILAARRKAREGE